MSNIALADKAEVALRLQGVTKRFGPTLAVDDFDLLVPRGALYGFIGPNGAGKTTTLRMIMSILFADSGRMQVLGEDSALAAKDRIGYLPEERGVYRKMRAGELLAYMARLKGIDARGLDKRVRSALARVGLEAAERKRCEELSKGMLQKLQFLAAIIHEPELLILDEPFSGLDPVSMRLLKDLLLEEHRRGATVLFSTHVMPQAEEICRHVVMIHKGRKVLDDELAEIQRRYEPRSLHFEPLDSAADLGALAALPGVERVETAERGCTIALAEGAEPGEAMRRIVAAIAPACIEIVRPRLEDIFIELVSGSAQTDAERRLRAPEDVGEAEGVA